MSQFTINSDSVDEIIRLLNRETAETGDETYRAIANTIEGQRRETGSGLAIGLAGLPAAGKSYIAEVLADRMSHEGVTETISMGDAIRERAPDGLDSDELGEFAADAREEDPCQIPRWVTELAERKDTDRFVIDGVRSPADYHVLNQHFAEFYLVHVHAAFEFRVNRIRDRGREGEEDFDRNDLLKRDAHEVQNLGFGDLRSMKVFDAHLRNEQVDPEREASRVLGLLDL